MTTMTKRTLLAMGSVMDIWPQQGYEAYMPKGTIQQRLQQQHLSATGRNIEKARERHDGHRTRY